MILAEPLVTLPHSKVHFTMVDVEKKTKALSIKMTPSDWKRIQDAAKRYWKRARMTNSEILLSFTLMGVEAANEERKKRTSIS